MTNHALNKRVLSLQQCKKIAEKIELIGHKHLNMLHGVFYYKINDNEIITAGEYKEN